MVTIDVPAGIVTLNVPVAEVVVVVVVPAGTPHGFEVAVCAAVQVPAFGAVPTVTVKPARAAPLTSSTAVPVIVTEVGVVVGVVVGVLVGPTVDGVGEEPPPPPHAAKKIRPRNAMCALFI
jgi:hypothetical protein